MRRDNRPNGPTVPPPNGWPVGPARKVVTRFESPGRCPGLGERLGLRPVGRCSRRNQSPPGLQIRSDRVSRRPHPRPHCRKRTASSTGQRNRRRFDRRDRRSRLCDRRDRQSRLYSRQIELAHVSRLARVELDALFRPLCPILQLLERDRLRPAPLRIEMHRPRAAEVRELAERREIASGGSLAVPRDAAFGRR